MSIFYEELSNGSTIVGEKKEETRTVSMAFAIKVGSADEDDSISGVSHFLEHTLFKGTQKRNAFEIKEPIERIGGSLNAYTGRVSTVYYAKVPDTSSLETLEIMHDLVSSPRFDEGSIELERGVILEEIASAEDDPFDRIYDMTMSKVWDRNFGRPILGYNKTVGSLSKEVIAGFYKSKYVASRTIFAVTGNFSDEFIERARLTLLSMPEDGTLSIAKSPSITGESLWILERRKDLQQVHLLLTKEAPGRKNSLSFESFKVFNILFGSGMSSILFHNIREELGMVYNINSEFVSYKDSGAFMINATTNPKNLDNLIDALKKELDTIVRRGIDKSHFNYGIERLKGKLLMTTEGTLSTLSRFLDDVVICGRPDNLENLIERIEGLKIDDINSVAREFLNGSWNVSLLLPQKTVISSFLKEQSFTI
jgi:predicted Zn-dependent peptidase